MFLLDHERSPESFPAAAQGAAAATAPTRASSLVALLAGHVLQDGEIVLFIIKPSLWFVILSALRFIAITLILMIAATLLDKQLPGANRSYQEFGSFLIAARLMWGLVQWMGRMYILTDLRIIKLSGVFTVDIYDCPLRKIARTRLLRPTGERLVRTGTLEIIPSDEAVPIGNWNTISRPTEIHDQVVAAINRARQ